VFLGDLDGVTSGVRRSCPQEAPRARQLRQAAESYVGIVMMIIGKNAAMENERNDRPHCFGGGSGNSRRGDCAPRVLPQPGRGCCIPECLGGLQPLQVETQR
jgi:hypothetical protein